LRAGVWYADEKERDGIDRGRERDERERERDREKGSPQDLKEDI